MQWREQEPGEVKMTVRVAINGFGRIGRNVLRAIAESGRTDIEVVGINDLGPVETNAHLLRFDSVHGRFPGEVTVKGDTINIGNGAIKVTAIKDPTTLPWKELGVEIAMECTGIDCVLHLDHGEDFEICKACVDGGFTSVMIDGSKYPFEENVALTKKVVEYAHSKGVPVEAESGKLAGVEDNISVTAKDAIYTDPAQAEEFVKRTGCDSLAVAIGTSHGAYKFKLKPGESVPPLRFDILEEVEKRTKPFDNERLDARSTFGEAFKFFKDQGFVEGDWNRFFPKPETQK